MIIDTEGNKRYKINLHTHTTISDGRVTPERSAEIYREAGYDMIAFTDHWKYGKERVCNGLKILSGCEYDRGIHPSEHIYHIVGIGMEKEPALVKGESSVQDMIDEINACGGVAILAHPCWSMNIATHAINFKGLDITEIYNTLSGCGANVRPYSGDFVDISANLGKFYNLVAADDTHFYNEEETTSYILVKSNSDDSRDIVKAIKAGDYFATQGPELFVSREGRKIKVKCTPVNKVAFFSDAGYSKDRVVYGDGITEAEYDTLDRERFVRVEVYDKEGKTAWSHIINL